MKPSLNNNGKASGQTRCFTCHTEKLLSSLLSFISERKKNKPFKLQ